ncbi:MAG: hypothetical protein LH624_02555 [Cryobacterium sp.]|nr:hypothetical protein [Cryobacterium sp.]
MHRTNKLVRGALLLIVLSAAAGCSITPTAHVNLETATGCGSVGIEQSVRGGTTTIRAQAAGCDASGGVTRETAAERVAVAVWQSLRRPVDVVEVDLSGIASPNAGPVVIQGSNLAERFEVGTVASEVPASDAVWLLLPAAYISVAVAMLMAVRRMNRASLIVVLIR